MWVTGDVELPDEILDAHERGELVFFVGAGASLGKPSNLPSFDSLAKKLARQASHPFSKRGGLDFFIGQLESLPQGFDTHHHAHTLISNPKSRFNPLHSAIVDLAGIGGTFRVVTTNYDDHLASAASSGSITIPDTWYAPALPLGRNFLGLVHLHGSVRRPKEEMILTDRDFGRAYITDAWAARFLLPMFDRFTVVFIGYSHDDVIMRYLALGLPSSGETVAPRRFAFTPDPLDSKWQYLGIRPIAYPVFGRDHRALMAALTEWAGRAKMGQTDHQSRVQAIIGGGTAPPLPDHDYLRARLRTTDGARDFAVATGSLPDDTKLEWLTWLEEFPEFKTLFSASDVSDATVILGNWFAKTFIESTTLNAAALQSVQRLGQSMTASLFRAATWAANDLSKQDSSAGKRWQALLVTSIYGQSAPLETELLMPFLDDSTLSMAVLRTALRPFLKLERRWFVDESAARTIHPDAKVTWNSEEYALTQHVRLVVQTSHPGDRSLGGFLEDVIVAAYDLLDAYHGEPGWDRLAHQRSAIEAHAQDEFREPVDAFIDGLRDYGIKALSGWPDLPERWWSLDRSLMQRLALHLVANDPARSADDKLSWLLGRTGLYEDGLKHETYQLLASAVATASPSLKRRVLDAAVTGPDYSEDIPDRDRHFAYAKYNLLAWLKQADPDWAEAQTTFDSAQSENPSFGVREHPDLDSWMTSGTWGGKPPMEVEEFIQTLAQSVNAAFDDLMSHDYSERHFNQPEWRDALGIVQQAAERRPDLGVQLWDAILGRDDLYDKQVDLWRVIAEGWGKAALRDAELAVIERVSTLRRDKKSAYSVGRFLLDQIQQQINVDESPMLISMRELARGLWDEQSSEFTQRGDASPLSLAPMYLNSWPGLLAQYWAREVDRRWRHSRDEWAGLSVEESDALTGLLNDNKHALDATQPAIAGKLFFYFAADENFAATHLIPLFNDPKRHAFSWAPFLHHPRWNDRLLAAGLFDSTVAELSRLHELPGRNRHLIFLGFVASVVSYAGITSNDRRRLLDQSVLASDGSHAAGFAEAVARSLREDGIDGAEVWRRWLGKHLERRINGQPRGASVEELARWADVVPFVGEFVPAAAMLLSGHGIGLGERFFNRKLADGVLITHGPELVAFFAERVGSTTGWDYMMRRRVRELVEATRGAVGDIVARPLIDAATDKRVLDVGE